MAADTRTRTSFTGRSKHSYSGSYGAQQVLKNRKENLSRYAAKSSSRTLAHRLNAPMPANTNFPDCEARGNTAASGFETSTKFKMSEANNGMDTRNQVNQTKINERRVSSQGGRRCR